MKTHKKKMILQAAINANYRCITENSVKSLVTKKDLSDFFMHGNKNYFMPVSGIFMILSENKINYKIKLISPTSYRSLEAISEIIFIYLLIFKFFYFYISNI